MANLKDLKVNRPRVNRVRPSGMNGSIVTGPCWSGIQALFQDSDFLQNYRMNPTKRRRREQGNE